MKDRPLPVVALTLLAIGLGGAALALGLALTSVAQVGFLLGEGRNSSLASLLGIAHLVVGVAGLVLAFGFWLQRSWAWGLGIATFGVSLVVNVISFAAGVSSLASTIFMLALGLLVVGYLLQPKVKALYGRGATAA